MGRGGRGGGGGYPSKKVGYIKSNYRKLNFTVVQEILEHLLMLFKRQIISFAIFWYIFVKVSSKLTHWAI